jgi:hypothetical protein
LLGLVIRDTTILDLATGLIGRAGGYARATLSIPACLSTIAEVVVAAVVIRRATGGNDHASIEPFVAKLVRRARTGPDFAGTPSTHRCAVAEEPVVTISVGQADFSLLPRAPVFFDRDIQRCVGALIVAVVHAIAVVVELAFSASIGVHSFRTRGVRAQVKQVLDAVAVLIALGAATATRPGERAIGVNVVTSSVPHTAHATQEDVAIYQNALWWWGCKIDGVCQQGIWTSVDIEHQVWRAGAAAV